MRGIILQILSAAKRDSLFLGTTATIFFITAMAIFFGSNALVEAQEMKIVYTASGSRILLSLGMIIFVSSYINRLFEYREIDILLSRPISKVSIVLSLLIGFYVLFLVILFPLVIILLALKVKFTYVLLWGMSIIFENFIMIAFSIFFSLLIKSNVYSIMLPCLLYFLARIIGSFISYIELSINSDFYQICASILKILGILIPRFDLNGNSNILLYGDFAMTDIVIISIQGILFISLIVLAIIRDFIKKEF